MTLSTFEGIVENGQIRLRDNVTLPENTKVYVIIPEAYQDSPVASAMNGSRVST